MNPNSLDRVAIDAFAESAYQKLLVGIGVEGFAFKPYKLPATEFIKWITGELSDVSKAMPLEQQVGWLMAVTQVVQEYLAAEYDVKLSS